MIELTQPSGQAIFVNPAHVQVVRPGSGKQTEVVTMTGVVTVLDSVLTVVDMVRGASRWEARQ